MPDRINYQQMQPAFNPFRQSMMMPQQTGFMQPQMTGFPGGFSQQQQPFLQPQQTGAMAFGNPQNPMFSPPQQQQQQQAPMFQPTPQQPFMQPAQTGFQGGMQSQQTGFLQPQGTGANPFRQSTMINTNISGPFSQPSSPFTQNQSSSPSFGQQIQRPGSTPAGGQAKPLVSQPTGSKNPFAPAPGSQAAKAATVSSRGPSMNELAMGFGRDMSSPVQNQAQSPWATVNGKPSSSSNGTGLGDVASSFVFGDSKKETSAADDFMAQFGGLSVNTSSTNPSTSTMTTSPTGTSQFNASAFGGSTNPSSPSSQFLQPQSTGFGGSAVKPFKPTSSFGSQLYDGLPPVSSPPSTSPGVGASPQAPSGGIQNEFTGFPGMGSQSTGGAGMQGQQTGMSQFGAGGFGTQQNGLPNPFRQGSMSSPSPGGMPFGSNPTGQQQQQQGGAFGANSPFAGQNRGPQQPQQQQNQSQGGFMGGSLI